MKLKNFFVKHWPILALTLIVLILAVTNYVPGTILSGWDNLHPEFNFPVNLKRSLFSVWEEYQGTGLLGGHAHSSDILRQISLAALSSLLPMEILRYGSMMFMVLSGTLGMYVFLRFLFRMLQIKTQPEVSAFLGALFYLLNLATIQTFYAPFEAFTAHFAALPWLLFSSLAFILTPSRKHTWFLVLSLLFALPMAYIPTLFVVYLIALGICLATLLFFSRSRILVWRIICLLFLIFLINAFWLLPFFYFTLTHAQITLTSKINQTATETIFLQNKEFGTLDDVPLLRGFWFNSVDPDTTGTFTYMLAPWREHLAQPLIAGIGYFLFLIVLTGAVIGFRRKQPLAVACVVLLCFSFTSLAIATPPFSWLNTVIRSAVPILNEAFRFPFTKFSILAAFTYAALFALGMNHIMPYIQTKWSRIQHKLLSPFFSHLPAILVALLLLIFTFPAFQGHFFYDKEHVRLPQEYRELFDFFKTQDPSGRIANLPQHTFWGWNFYHWGYGGSGFLWYALPQPILDRAFDVWSAQSENYYYEISQVIYEKDPVKLRAVLDKYEISWLLLDENVIYPPSPKALFYPETEDLLRRTPGVTAVKHFGNIRVYAVASSIPRSHFISTAGKLPSVNEYTWTNDDAAYRALGPYRSAENPDYVYPFRTLATLKTAAEQDIRISETGTDIILSTMLPAQKTRSGLKVPSYAATERIVPVHLRTVERNNQLVLEAVILSPQVTLGEKVYGGQTSVRPLFRITRQANSHTSYTLHINGIRTITIPPQPQLLTTTFFSLTEPNILSLQTGNAKPQLIRIDPQELRGLPQFAARTITFPPTASSLPISMRFPRIKDPYLSFTIQANAFSHVENCDGFRNGTVDMQVTDQDAIRDLKLSSGNATACISYYAQALPHDIGYIIGITGKNVSGRPLHFWVENIDQRRGAIDTYLPEEKFIVTTSYLLPPSESFGKAYAFHFDNASIGQDQPVNVLQSLSVSPFPYHFTLSLVSSRQPTPKKPTLFPAPQVAHPNEGLYIISSIDPNAQTLILSQAYDPGWKAYSVANSKWPIANSITFALPFFFGREIKEHTQVNNWANGWIIGNSPELVIVYLPQYLQYLGSVLTVGTLLAFSLRLLRKKRRETAMFP